MAKGGKKRREREVVQCVGGLWVSNGGGSKERRKGLVE